MREQADKERVKEFMKALGQALAKIQDVRAMLREGLIERKKIVLALQSN